MNDLEKGFIPYEQALSLKELGFCEPCFGYYYTTNGKDWQFAEKSEYYRLDDEINIGPSFSLLAPLYQQAFRFFREKHNLDSWIYCPNESKGYFAIILKHKRFVSYHENFDTYEEAELACLNKLIEIVKNGNKS